VTSSQRRARPAHKAGAKAPAPVTVESVRWPAELPPALVRKLTVEWQPRPPDERDLALSRLLFGNPQEASRG